MKPLQATNGLFYKNSYSADLTIVRLVDIGERWRWMVLRFPWLVMGHVHVLSRRRLLYAQIAQIKPQHQGFKPRHHVIRLSIHRTFGLELGRIMDTARHGLAEEKNPFLARGHHGVFDRMAFFSPCRCPVVSCHPVDERVLVLWRQSRVRESRHRPHAVPRHWNTFAPARRPVSPTFAPAPATTPARWYRLVTDQTKLTPSDVRGRRHFPIVQDEHEFQAHRRQLAFLSRPWLALTRGVFGGIALLLSLLVTLGEHR